MKFCIQDITPKERKLLSCLKKRPGLFLGETSFHAFWQWSGGYEFAMGLLGKSATRNMLPYGLREFTEQYLGAEPSTWGCYSLIVQHEPDDVKAFNLFFEVLDAYLISLGYAPIPEWDDSVAKTHSLLDELAEK